MCIFYLLKNISQAIVSCTKPMQSTKRSICKDVLSSRKEKEKCNGILRDLCRAERSRSAVIETLGSIFHHGSNVRVFASRYHWNISFCR